jgi:hypothetical protein
LYPFYDPELKDSILQVPLYLQGNNEMKKEFYSYCEHWYEKCIFNDIFEIQSDLPYSDGGLGLICIKDVSDIDLKEAVVGILEFIDEEMFEFLKLNDCSSLYITNEGDYCVLVGPLALCNNGRSVVTVNQFPEFTDRGLNDEELMYQGFRKDFQPFPQGVGCIHIEFEHFALRMDVRGNIIRTAGSQILVDYGFVTVVVVNLI